jgi:outer membrane protein assembly factor BamB
VDLTPPRAGKRWDAGDGGGLVFSGSIDRAVRAYDDANGNVLWEMVLNDVPNSAPISYTADGKQYIAVVVGGGGAQANSFVNLVPEIANPTDRGATLWVFELPTASFQ